MTSKILRKTNEKTEEPKMTDPQFDLLGGIHLRDDALKLVGANSGDFMKDAVRAFPILFDPGTEVMGEEIRQKMVRFGIEPHHANAWGALTRSLCVKGHLSTDRAFLSINRADSGGY